MNYRRTIYAAVSTAVLVGGAPAFAQFADESAKMSYAFGANLARQVRSQLSGVLPDLDGAAFSDGLRDVLTGGEVKISDQEIQQLLNQAQQQVQQRQLAAAGEAGKIGEEYRNKYAGGEGVQSTDSGILYTVIQKGEGASPTKESTVVVHYRGTLINGDEFDSSYKRDTPATFQLGGIIPGWQEVLQLMTPGSKWEVVIPPELAYGPRGAGQQIGPNQTLIFEIELLEVK